MTDRSYTHISHGQLFHIVSQKQTTRTEGGSCTQSSKVIAGNEKGQYRAGCIIKRSDIARAVDCKIIDNRKICLHSTL